MSNLVQAPTASERATAMLIVGLLLAVTTPVLAPTAAGAVWIGVSLARGGHRLYAAAVLVATAAGIALLLAGSL
jgi:hypothetical protein